MYIKKLILTSFGKFKNKTIDLEKGINILYGENEAGKSTIHKFIEGMFFGFFKSYSKRKMYTTDYEKYLPWDSNEYKGILIYEHKGINYRIERTFNKQDEKVLIFDDDTGEDITYLFEYNKKIRLPEPASKDLGLNVTLYNNTINIFESNRKSSKDLAKEIKDKMVHMSNSKVDSISVKNVIEDLNKKLNDIGSPGKTKTPYGKLVIKLDKLKAEKKQAQINEEEIKEIQYDINKLNTDKIELEKKLKDIDGKLNLYDKYIVQTQLRDIEKVKKEINEIDLYIKENKELKNYSIDQLDEAMTNLQLKNKYAEDRIRTINEIDKVKEKIAACMNYGIDNELTNLTKEINKLNVDEEINKKTLYEESSKNLKRNIKKWNVFIIITNIISVLTIILFVLKNDWLFLMTLGIGITLSIVSIVQRIKTINKLKYVRNLIMSNNKSIENKKAKYEKLIAYRETMYMQANNNIIVDEYTKSLDSLNVELNRINDEILNLTACNRQFENYTYDDLKNLKKELSNVRESMQKKSIKEQLLNKLCKRDNIDLYSQVKNISDEIEQNITSIKNIDRQELTKEKSVLMDNLKQLEIKIGRLNEKQNNMIDKSRNVIDIIQEIRDVCDKKDSYEEDIQALNVAIQAINEISSNIQHDFAPNLNNTVSHILSDVTNGKYNNIKITKEMDVKIIDPKTNEMMSIDKLSCGTIDQIYFAFRIALADVLKGNDTQYPLILDDSFVHYDDKRLKEIINFLINNINNKQIILFSCHKREKEILKQIDSKYHYQIIKNS